MAIDPLDEPLKSEDAAVSGLQAEASIVDKDIDALTSKLTMLNAGKVGILVAGVVKVQGGIASVPISLVTGPLPIAGLQVDVLDISSAPVLSVEAGPAAVSAGKQVASNKIASAERFLLFGLNQNIIGPGVVAILKYDVAALAPGAHLVMLTNFIASDATGNTVPLCGMSGLVEVA